MAFTCADALRLVEDTSANGLRAVAPEAVATHIAALRRASPGPARWDVAPTGAALIAAARLGPAIAPVVAGLRAGSLRLGGDDGGAPAGWSPELDDARLEVATALGWAWCALLDQRGPSPARWVIRTCAITQRWIIASEQPPIERLRDAIDRANHALVHTSVLASTSSLVDGLPRRQLATGVGTLGVAHHVLGTLRPR